MLGPANDDDPNVRIEIRAAEIAIMFAEDPGWTGSGWAGWTLHKIQTHEPHCGTAIRTPVEPLTEEQEAAWLAREIHTWVPPTYQADLFGGRVDVPDDIIIERDDPLYAILRSYGVGYVTIAANVRSFRRGVAYSGSFVNEEPFKGPRWRQRLLDAAVADLIGGSK